MDALALGIAGALIPFATGLGAIGWGAGKIDDV